MEILSLFSNPDFWFGVIRSTTPILFAAIAALLAARAGIVNMAIEGIMLFAALFAVIGAWLSGSALVGILVAVLTGIGITLFLAYFKIKMKADEIMAAIALNLLANGGTIFILYLVSGDKGTSSSLNSPSLSPIHIPFIENIPFIGPIVSGHSFLVYLAFVSVIVVNYLLFKTPLGLRIRSVGGNAHAAESVGVSVEKTQYIAMALSGVFAGLAGAYMSMTYLTIFTKGMVAGRGYIALAASNVGGRAPIGAMFASLLFGFFDSLGNNLQRYAIPPEFIYMIPYIATIVMYTYFSYRRITLKKRRKAAIAKLQLEQNGH
ncbi:MAG: ABC transporter permease [Erysipelothrix sp.]|nr:ABC transporter permease [Erysipelothrix sp.]